MKLTLSKVRTAKNGLVSYKANRKRTNGTVYVDAKMFGGVGKAAPDTITIEAEGLVEPEAEVAPAAQAQPAQEQPVAQ